MQHKVLARAVPLSVAVILAVWLVLAFVVTVFAAGPTIYVRPAGDDTNCNGTVDVDYSAGVAPACAVQTIQKGIDLVDPSGTVYVRAGTYVLSAAVNLNKTGITLDGDGAGATIVQVSGAGERFNFSATGVTLQDFEIVKTDKPGVQNIIGLFASNATVKNNTIHGQFVIGDPDVSRAVVGAGGLSGLNIEGNTIYGLRQPGYFSGPTTGTIQNNYVYGTKGWVLEGGSLTFTGNTWGTGAQSNVYDIAILAMVGAGPYPDIVAMSNANNGAVIEDQRVSPAVLSVVYVDAATSYTTDLGGRYHPYSSITPAVTRVVAGGTIHVAAGTYAESVTVNKHLALIGVGSGASDTVITAGGGSGGAIQLAASGLSAAQPILLQDLRIQPVGKAGISVGQFTQATGTNVSFVELNNVKVIGTNTSPCTEQERGLYVDLTSSLTNLKITNSAFDNLHYGWYFQKQVSTDTSTVQYVDVQNTTFNHNNLKGIYAEKLEDATFTGITVSQNGYDGSLLTGCSYFTPNLAGVDVNLKAGTYQNLTFTNGTITNNALGGAKEGVGLAIKARDDGATYGAYPATLSNVSVADGEVSGNERGIRLGEPGKNNTGPTNVTVQAVCIFNNVKTYTGTDGSAYGGLVNQSQTATTATHNWWGDASGPYNAASNPGGTGNAVSDNVSFDPWIIDGCGGALTNDHILSLNTTDDLICTGETTVVTIDLAETVDLYGYEFEVSYNASYASAAGAFVNSFFDTTPPVSIPPAWNAVCAAGVCRFAVSHISTSPQQAVSGSGPLAQITLSGVAPGTFSMAIGSDVLSDINGAPLPHTVGAPLPITVCGYATISGFVTMQGRPGNNVDTGTVSLIEQAPVNFTPVAPVPFSASNGAYSIQVPYMPGGSSYQMVAEHGLYLDNAKLFTISGNLANENTRLWGGDANNDGDVTIGDLSCIGADFGSQPPTSTCGGTGSPDINADGKVNIQDLSIAGGNFDKCGAQPWAWQTGTPVMCP